MSSMRKILSVAALLVCAGLAGAQPAGPAVVFVSYTVPGAGTEQIEKELMEPVGKALRKLARASEINSTASEEALWMEIAFRGGATRTDLAEVIERIAAVKLAEPYENAPRSVELGPAKRTMAAVESAEFRD